MNQERVSDSQQSHALFAGTDGHFILNVYLNICHHIVVVIVLLTSCRTHCLELMKSTFQIKKTTHL